VWTADGRRIAFRSTRDNNADLYWQRADGSGDVQRLTEGQNSQTPKRAAYRPGTIPLDRVRRHHQPVAPNADSC
jgi:hypothetical protein